MNARTPTGDDLANLDLLNEISNLHAKLSVARQLLEQCLHPVKGVPSDSRLATDIKYFLDRSAS